MHYRVQAPFRYPPPPGGSSFRAPNDSGVCYGAELGDWRWRLVQDTDEQSELPPVAPTAFCIDVGGDRVDLRCKPFFHDSAAWTAPNVGWCATGLNPDALAPTPNPTTQTRWLAMRADPITRKRVQNQPYPFAAPELLGGGA